MKKNDAKTLVKAAKKNAENEIKESLITQLTEVTGKLSQPSKKLDKKIRKGAKQLAKRLAKDLKIDKSALTANQPAEAPAEASDATTAS